MDAMPHWSLVSGSEILKLSLYHLYFVQMCVCEFEYLSGIFKQAAVKQGLSILLRSFSLKTRSGTAAQTAGHGADSGDQTNLLSLSFSLPPSLQSHVTV